MSYNDTSSISFSRANRNSLGKRFKSLCSTTHHYLPTKPTPTIFTRTMYPYIFARGVIVSHLISLQITNLSVKLKVTRIVFTESVGESTTKQEPG